jgi:hypothetical protein
MLLSETVLGEVPVLLTPLDFACLLVQEAERPYLLGSC